MQTLSITWPVVTAVFTLALEIGQTKAEIICDNQAFTGLDQSVANILMNGPGRKYPESREEMPRFCNDVLSSIRYIEDYRNQCMRNLAKQLTGVFVYTVKKMFNDLCRKKSKRLNRVLSSAQCMNALNGLKDSCYTKFIDALLGIYHADNKYKVPHICCAYSWTEECDRNNGLKLAACAEDKLEASLELRNELAQNSVDFLCGDYTSESDKCQRLPARPLKKRGQTRTKSFLLPMIDILESLPDSADNY